MADSPIKGMDKGYLSVLVLVAGKEIPKTLFLVSVEVVKEINKIPYAKLVLHDGDTREQKFTTSEDPNFEPGKEVEIKAGYGPGLEATIFKGVIVEHGIRHSAYSGSSLVLKLKDKALKLTVGRKNKVYLDKKDSDIISEAVQESGLTADVEATTAKHKKLIQYFSTNWDFIQSRADVNGLVTIINDGKISIKKPTVSAKSELIISYGKDLVEMDLNIDSTYQYTEIKSSHWDHAKQALEKTDGKKPTVNSHGALNSGKIGKVIGGKTMVITSPEVTKDVIQAWADSLYQRGHLSRVRGTIKFYGSTKAEVGKTIELFGLGKNFVGDGYVSSVRHTIERGQWMTEVGLGLDPQPYMEANLTASSLPAGGVLPAIHGLHHGVVKAIKADPDGEFRVQINIPIIDNMEGAGVWARMSHYYATEDCGFVFYPEVGDEVIVGFFNNDPSYPVIMGSLYSSKRKITTAEKHEPADPNQFKAISLQKGKMRLEFDDKDCIIKLITPEKNTIIIDDKEKMITIEDVSNKNKIILSKDGILLDSGKDIIMKAKSNIKMEATSNIETKSTADTKIEATGNFSFKGMAVKGEGSTTLELKGSATAKLEGGGMCEIKGGLVKIN
jgi:Rhs element Vgr protein